MAQFQAEWGAILADREGTRQKKFESLRTRFTELREEYAKLNPGNRLAEDKQTKVQNTLKLVGDELAILIQKIRPIQ